MKLFKLSIYFLLLGILGVSCSDDPEAPSTPDQQAPEATKTIKDIKALVTGDDAYEIPEDYIIKAVVLSNQDESNNFYRSLFIQDDETAIKISCNEDSFYSTLKQGQEVTLTADGLHVAKSYDTYVIGYDPTDDNYKVDLIPAETLSEILIAGDEDQEFKTTEITDLSNLSTDLVGSWVKISNIQVVESQIGAVLADGSSSYGTITMTDVNGLTFQISTNKYSNFADFEMPEGSGSITGIMGTYSGEFQITLTSSDNINLTGERFTISNDICDESVAATDYLYETFTDVVNYDEFEADGWLNILEAGERTWQEKVYDSNGYIQATAHNATEGTNTTMVVSPPLDIDNAATKILRFKTAQAYYNETTTLEVYAIQCVDSNPVETKLEAVLASPDAQEDYEFVSSGDIDLSAFSGTVRIGFRYSGQGGSSNSTTWCIDDFEFNNTVTSVEFTSSPETVVQSEGAYEYAITTSITNENGTTTITAADLPTWLTLTDNGDGTATLSGTAPTVTENESISISLTATNNSVSTTQDFTLLLQAPVAPGSNLVVNGSFEDWTGDLPTGWDNSSYNTNMTIENSIVYEGSNSVKHTAGTSKMQQEVTITGGNTYTVSYRFLDNDANAKGRMWSYWTDGSSTINDTDTDNSLRQSTYSEDNSDWQTVSVTVTAPAAATTLRFEIRTYNDNDGSGVIYYDDFSVIEQ